MKYTLSLFTVALMGLVVLAVAGFAAVPTMISYQGLLTDAGGTPVANDTYELTFKIYDQTPTERWSETHSVATVDGLFSVMLGSNGTPLTDTHLDYAECWLGITLTGDPEMTPRSQLISSPFALQAEVAQEAQSALTVADNAVTSVKIVDGEVMTDDLDDEAVTSLKIADATIQFVDIGTNGATEGQVMKMVGGNWVAADDDGGSGADADWTIAGNDQYSAVSGNVGIGITTPSYKLHVAGGNSYFGGNIYTIASGRLGLGTTSPSQVLHVSGNGYITGNLGIGVSAPTHKLQVGGDSYFGGDAFFSTGDLTIGSYILGSYPLYFEGSVDDDYQTRLYVTNPTADQTIALPDASGTVALTSDITAGGWTDDGSAVRLTNSSDYVGIGTTNPTSELHVEGDTYSSNDLLVGNRVGIGTTGPICNLHVEGNSLLNGSVGIGLYPTIYKLAVTGGNVYFGSNLYTMGNVGIGTTSPSVALHVAGSICYTGGIGACSDARYKKNVETVSGALGMVSKLRGVRFNWRPDEYPDQKFTDAPQLGLIAQEVKEIFPELVMQDDNGYYSVDYVKLTPVLVEAVKELKAEVVELKADHAASLAEMQAQLAQVSQLVETLLAQNEPGNSNSKKLAGK